MTDGILVLFASLLLGHLAGEPEAPENLPRITFVILYAELLVDDLRHPLAGPQIRAVASLEGTGQQDLDEPLFVRLVQSGRTPGSGFGSQGFDPAFQDGFLPAFDRREARPDEIRHLLQRTTLQNETTGNTPTRLPFYVHT
jgi:hypothetical protein